MGCLIRKAFFGHLRHDVLYTARFEKKKKSACIIRKELVPWRARATKHFDRVSSLASVPIKLNKFMSRCLYLRIIMQITTSPLFYWRFKSRVLKETNFGLIVYCLLFLSEVNLWLSAVENKSSGKAVIPFTLLFAYHK